MFVKYSVDCVVVSLCAEYLNFTLIIPRPLKHSSAQHFSMFRFYGYLMGSCDRVRLFTREHDKSDQNKKSGIGRNVTCMTEARKVEVKVYVKVKVTLERPRRPIGGKYSYTLSLTSDLDGVGG